MLRFTLRQLEYLVAVGETGSVAAAAERVKVSPPSISVAIAQVEAQFGMALFLRRQAHGMAVTQAGRQLIEQAKRVLDEADRLNALGAQLTGTVRGPLHVGCLLTFAQIVLPQLRRGLVDAYPDIEFRQFEGNQSEIIDGLRSARLDIALTYDLDIPTDLSFIPLVALPPYAVMDVAHPLARRETVSPHDLAGHPMVLLDLPLSADYFLSAFTALGLKPVIAERTRDMAVMRSLVANGFGYSIGNIRPVSDLAPDGKPLRFVPLTGSLRPMQMGLVLAEGSAAVLSIGAFIDHCRRTIRSDTLPGMHIGPGKPGG